MHVNRPSQLIFPPTTPTATGALLDATDTDAKETAHGTDKAAGASRTHRAATVSQPAESPSQAAGVQVDLQHSQRAHAALTYGRDGLFAGKSGVEVANTPAERFVASAVEVMRAYEQERTQQPSSPLGRLKQAVAARFSAHA